MNEKQIQRLIQAQDYVKMITEPRLRMLAGQLITCWEADSPWNEPITDLYYPPVREVGRILRIHEEHPWTITVTRSGLFPADPLIWKIRGASADDALQAVRNQLRQDFRRTVAAYDALLR